MATSAEDRLAKLFRSGNRPARPAPNEKTFAEKELEQLEEKNATWKIPATAQYPRKVKVDSPQPAAGRDILTGSDDDDYVSAFNPKPTMKQAASKKKSHKQAPRQMPEPDAFGYPKDAKVEPTGRIAYIEDWSAEIKNNGGAEYERKASAPRELSKTDDRDNPATGHFCQLGLVAKFPYKYMTDENDRVSRHFFANNKFYERTWDLYYLHPPESLGMRPFFLLPYHQVKALTDEISNYFRVEVHVPRFPFKIPFFDDGTPQPVFLGTAMSRADINDLQESIPDPAPGHGEAPHNATPEQEHSFAAFKAKVERAHAAEKRKKAAVKKKKAHDRFLNIQDWCKQLRRTQQYLGVRPEPRPIQAPPPDMPWEGQEIFNREEQKKAGVVLKPLNLTKPAPHDFRGSPVFISVDIESYEKAHEIITEIGISTLDTLDLVGFAPGEGGENWMKQIRSRHFRIKGRETYINDTWCIGDGNAFQFGESEWINLQDAGDVVDSCFEWPYSVQFKHDGTLKFHAGNGSRDDAIEQATHDAPEEQKQSNAASEQVNGNANNFHESTPEQANSHFTGPDTVTNDTSDIPPTKRSNAIKNNPEQVDPTTAAQGSPHTRTLLLVGHDLNGDLSYLSKLNSAIFSRPRDGSSIYPPHPDTPDLGDARATKGSRLLSSIIEALDTAVLYRVLLHEQNNRSLITIMSDLGRSALYAHNAGNDARYTMEALVGLTIKSRLMDDEAEAAKQREEREAIEGTSVWETEKERRVAEKVEAAKHEAEEDARAWEAAGATGTYSLKGPPKSGEQEEFVNGGAVTVDQNGSDTGKFTTFTETLVASHRQGERKKKSPETKRREYETRAREEDGIEGPCDWAVGGKDGVGK